MSEKDFTLTLEMSPQRDVLRIPSIEVLATGPTGTKTRTELGLTGVVVGSDPQCDIVIDDARVSRRHCALLLTEHGVVLRDLGSKNGTHAAGLRIHEAAITDGVAIAIGGSQLTLSIGTTVTHVPLSATCDFGGAVGVSATMRVLFAFLTRVAPTDETILVRGESGTGKEVLARAIHDLSKRSDAPFVVFDCAAVTPSLVESELFGHVRGAFSGAVADRAGALEHAGRGTLLLDEIGELPLDLQPKLLRVLESREIRPVGSNRYRPFEARVIAATHRDLRGLVSTGTFRQDLYFRLAVVEAKVPPLRERKEDIEPLVARMLAGRSPPRTIADLPANAIQMLEAHDWPGNVRELRNLVARMLLFPELVPDALLEPRAGTAAPTDGFGALLALPLREAREQVVARFEERYVTAQLAAHNGSPLRASEAMGVSRQLVHRLMDRHGIRSERP